MIVECTYCKTKNRLPTEGKAEDYENRVFYCSKCSKPLFEKKDKVVFDYVGHQGSTAQELKNTNKQPREKNKSKTLTKEPKLPVKPSVSLNQSLSNVESKIRSFLKEHKDKKNGAIILAILLALFLVVPMFNSYKSDYSVLSELDGTNPNNAKEQLCRKLVKRYGHISRSINSHYYGRGVDRPQPSQWYLKKLIEPGWFRDELNYIYYNQTADKFTHTAYCIFKKENYYELNITDFEGRPMLICWRYDDNNPCLNYDY